MISCHLLNLISLLSQGFMVDLALGAKP